MKSRNELANYFRMARETGKLVVAAVKRETCSLCCEPLEENDKTDSDEHGPYHRNPYICIERLQEQQRALEEALDSTREQLHRRWHKQQIRLLKKAEKARKQP